MRKKSSSIPVVLMMVFVMCISSSAIVATLAYFSWEDIRALFGFGSPPAPAPSIVLSPTYQTIVAPKPNDPPSPPPKPDTKPPPPKPDPKRPPYEPKTPPNDPDKTPPKTPPNMGCPDPGCDAIVEEHNRVRAAHGVHEKLAWDAGLQAVAQARVDWNVAHGKTGHDAFYANIERQGLGAGPENAYGAVGFAGAAEGWAKSVGHAPHTLGRNVTKVGCATHPNGGYMPSICVYDAWGKICGDPTICAMPTNVCRCHIDEKGHPWGCC